MTKQYLNGAQVEMLTKSLLLSMQQGRIDKVEGYCLLKALEQSSSVEMLFDGI